jgi:hypothetical protein
MEERNMTKSTKPKKKISFTLKASDYERFTRYAEREERGIASAARIIILNHMRNIKT